MPLFGKKKGGGAGADGPEVEDVVGQGWGIRGAHGQLMDKSGNTIANKGTEPTPELTLRAVAGAVAGSLCS